MAFLNDETTPPNQDRQPVFGKRDHRAPVGDAAIDLHAGQPPTDKVG
jgi:hypothetical protein